MSFLVEPGILLLTPPQTGSSQKASVNGTKSEGVLGADGFIDRGCSNHFFLGTLHVLVHVDSIFFPTSVY